MSMRTPVIVIRGLNVQESGMTPTLPVVSNASVIAMADNEATADFQLWRSDLTAPPEHPRWKDAR